MTVTFYGRITEYTNGEKTFMPSASHSTLSALLGELSGHYGEAFESFIHGNEACLILVNGNGVMMSGGLDSPLKPDDRIDILPFVDAG